MRIIPDGQLKQLLIERGRGDLLKGFDIDEQDVASHLEEIERHHRSMPREEREALAVYTALFDVRSRHKAGRADRRRAAKRTAQTPERVRVAPWIRFAVILLFLLVVIALELRGQAPAAQPQAGLIVRGQNAGTTLFNRGSGLLTFNCTGGLGCSFANNVFTLDGAAAGGTVDSVFGRTGAVSAEVADYAAYYAALVHDHDTLYPRLDGSYANPAWLSSLAWSKLTGVPSLVETTGSYANPSWLTSLAWSKLTGVPSYEPAIAAGTTAQYWRGDKSWQTLNAAAVANAVSTTGSYSNPSWLTGLAWSKITGAPTNLSPWGLSGSNVYYTGGETLLGTSTDLGAYRLQVTGDGALSGSLTAGLFASTADTALRAGIGRSAAGHAYVDLIGDTTYTDYGLRLIRWGGAGTGSLLSHRGTGPLTIATADAAPIVFSTTAAERMRIESGGTVTTTGDINVGSNAYIANSSGASQNTFRIDGFTNRLYLVAASAAGAPTGSSIGFFTAPAGGGDGAERLIVNSNGTVQVNGSAWNGTHLILGNYHLWVDSTHRLRISNGTPLSDTDGQTVGTQ